MTVSTLFQIASETVLGIPFWLWVLMLWFMVYLVVDTATRHKNTPM